MLWFNKFFIKGSSAPDYIRAANNVVIVGKEMANLIRIISIDPTDIHCIGHSLGMKFSIY